MKPNQTEGSTGVEDLKNQITKLDEIGINLRAKLEQQLLDSFEDGYNCCKCEKEDELAACLAALKELIELADFGYSVLSVNHPRLLEYKSAIERAKKLAP